MFINCKHCGSLVATDAATDLPPERCPRCRGVLRSAVPAPQISVATLLRASSTAGVAAVAVDASEQDTAVSADDADSGAASEPETSEAQTAATPDDAQAPASFAEPSVAEPSVATSPAATSPVAAPDAGTSDRASDATGTAAPDAAEVSTPPSAPLPPAAAATTPAPSGARASPSFARRGASGARDTRLDRQRRILSAAVVALALLLGLQIVLADRARLAADPAWRPALTRLCGVLRCSLPPWREPAALTVLARDVRPDPATSGHLLAVATFRNDARWAQAWPRMRLTLSDIHGRTVGSRVFTAAEYLGDAPQSAALAAGQSAQVRLQLREPDARAVSFAFDFL